MTISKKDEVDVYLYLIAEFIVKKYATLDSILLWFAFLAFLNCDILRDINAAYDNNFLRGPQDAPIIGFAGISIVE